MSSNNGKTAKTRRGESNLASTVVLFVIMMALFFGALYSLSFLTLGNPWPMLACLALFALAFWFPQTITGRSDSAGEH